VSATCTFGWWQVDTRFTDRFKWTRFVRVFLCTYRLKIHMRWPAAINGQSRHGALK
jgi:hypothetical protein